MKTEPALDTPSELIATAYPTVCRVGNVIWQRHKWGIGGECLRGCGAHLADVIRRVAKSPNQK